MHLTEEPPRLDGVAPLLPPEVVELVHKLLLKDPALRPTMREVVAELERMQAQRGSASAQSVPTPRRPPGSAESGESGESDNHDGDPGVSPQLRRPSRDLWKRPYSDGRTEGAGDLGPVVNAYDHTLSSGPIPLPRVVQQEAGTQVNSGPHYAPPRAAPDPGASTLIPPSPPSPVSMSPSSAAQSSGVHTAPGTGERTPVPPRPHGRWSLFLASLLGGLTVVAAGWVLRSASPGPAPVESRPPGLNVAASPSDAQLRALPPPVSPTPTPPTPAPSPPASLLTGQGASPGSQESGPERAPEMAPERARDLSTTSGPSAPSARGTGSKRPKVPARPAAAAKKPGSDAAHGVSRPDPPPQNRPPDAAAKPQFKIID